MSDGNTPYVTLSFRVGDKESIKIHLKSETYTELQADFEKYIAEGLPLGGLYSAPVEGGTIFISFPSLGIMTASTGTYVPTAH